MKAFLKNYRQSPRKVRLVASLVKGKNVASAITELDFLAKRAGLPIKKLLLSAVANAKFMGIEVENLFIKELRVDKGITLRRMMPRAMGTGHRINKRSSHLNILLAEKVVPVKKSVGMRSTDEAVINKKPIVKKIKEEGEELTTKKSAKALASVGK